MQTDTIVKSLCYAYALCSRVSCYYFAHASHDGSELDPFPCKYKHFWMLSRVNGTNSCTQKVQTYSDLYLFLLVNVSLSNKNKLFTIFEFIWIIDKRDHRAHFMIGFVIKFWRFLKWDHFFETTCRITVQPINGLDLFKLL